VTEIKSFAAHRLGEEDVGIDIQQRKINEVK
jgi:hypothetical protein